MARGWGPSPSGNTLPGRLLVAHVFPETAQGFKGILDKGASPHLDSGLTPHANTKKLVRTDAVFFGGDMGYEAPLVAAGQGRGTQPGQLAIDHAKTLVGEGFKE